MLVVNYKITARVKSSKSLLPDMVKNISIVDGGV
jgi:hypothetical protein